MSRERVINKKKEIHDIENKLQVALRDLYHLEIEYLEDTFKDLFFKLPFKLASLFELSDGRETGKYVK